MSWSWPSEKLEIVVTLETADEILSLRARVCHLEAEAVAAQAKYNALEFRYRCECIINTELVDLCHTSKIKYRPSLRGRPFDGPNGPQTVPDVPAGEQGS